MVDKIDPKVIDEATKRNVNVYVQYAFISKKDGRIVFSNPKKLNNLGNELPSTTPGSLDKPATLDVKNATQWARTSRANKEQIPNPTNNSADE